MDVTTPSDISPRKARAIRVGCHEKSVPLNVATGMLSAHKSARTWMLLISHLIFAACLSPRGPLLLT